MKRRPNQLTIRLSNSFKNPVRFGNPVRAMGIALTMWNAQVYVDIDQDIHKVKLKVVRNEKRKQLRGFSFSINVANFEAFRKS